MNTKFLLGITITALMLLAVAADTYAQPCKFRKSDCQVEESENVDVFADFDYRSQSAYAQMSPGDIQEVRFVIYRGKDYQVFTCQDFDLGDVQVQIINPERRTERIVKDVNVTEEEVYKTDDMGEVIYKEDDYGDLATDEYGEYIPAEVLGTRKIYDTVWETRNYIEEVILFDSNNNKAGTKIWEKRNVKRTSTLRARVIVPDGDPEYIGCVSVLIGYRHSNYNKFVRGSSHAD